VAPAHRLGTAPGGRQGRAPPLDRLEGPRSRLAYVELHPDERAATVTAFVERALEFFGSHGITTRRLMTDNAFSYVKNRSLRELLASKEIRHITTKPYRPQTNGKVERFHQTMAREWAYGMAYRSHRHRNRALPHWLEHYNETRPHSSVGGRPRSVAFTTSVGRTTS
jgi:transposase